MPNVYTTNQPFVYQDPKWNLRTLSWIGVYLCWNHRVNPQETATGTDATNIQEGGSASSRPSTHPASTRFGRAAGRRQTPATSPLDIQQSGGRGKIPSIARRRGRAPPGAGVARRVGATPLAPHIRGRGRASGRLERPPGEAHLSRLRYAACSAPITPRVGPRSTP